MTSRRHLQSIPGGAPKLTPEQRAQAAKFHYIAARVASYYARKNPPGLSESDLLSEAEEALAAKMVSADLANDGLESYLWECVRGAVKDLMRKTAKEQRRVSSDSDDGVRERLLQGASSAIGEFVRTLQDPGNLWGDTPEDAKTKLESTVHDAAAALAFGGAGNVWYLRGEEGLVLRAEWVRTTKELHDLVAELPRVLAVIIELRFFQQRELKEIAAHTGLSVPTVSRRIEEALKLLRARLTAKNIESMSEVQ